MLDLGLSILDLGLWLGGKPHAGAGQRQPGHRRDASDRSSSRGSAFVVCENGISLFVDVTWRHLGDGERFGVGRAREQGNRGDQSAHGVEGAARRADRRVADRLGKPGEPLHRVVSGGVGPLRRRHRGRGQGPGAPGASGVAQGDRRRCTARRWTAATWPCEAERTRRYALAARRSLPCSVPPVRHRQQTASPDPVRSRPGPS